MTAAADLPNGSGWGAAESASARAPDPAPPVDSHPRDGPPVDSGWLHVRVLGPTGAVDVSLATGRATADLVSELLGGLLPGAPVLLPGAGWHLHPLGRAPLEPGALLREAGLRDGAVLHLTPHRAPPAATVVDDPLDDLAAGAAQAGIWTLRAAAAVLSAAVPCYALALAAVAVLAPVGAGAAAAVLLFAAVVALAAAWAAVPSGRTQSGASAPAQELWRGVVAAAALPTLAVVASAAARALQAGTAATVGVGGLALGLGSYAAAALAPRLCAAWAFLSAGGVLVALAAAAAWAGCPGTTTAAVGGCLALVGTAALPGLLARSGPPAGGHPYAATGDRPAGAPARAGCRPAGGDSVRLQERARTARQLLTGLVATGAAAVTACGVVLSRGDPPERGLAVALAVVLALRARRSRFVLETTAMLTGAVLVLAVVLSVVQVRPGGGTVAARALPALPTLPALPAGLPAWLLPALLPALLAALLAVLLAVLRAVLRAQDGRPAGLARLSGPRVRRLADAVELAAAVAVLPLLAAALGLYTLAADAGARL